MKRIVITGAESTGKTTLAQALSAHFNEPYSEEYVRSFVDSINRTILKSDFNKIAEGQRALEELARNQADKLVFHDTNILSNLVYGRHYLKIDAEDLEARLNQEPYDLYLFCQDDIPWMPDGIQRDSAQARKHLQMQFSEALSILKANTVLISGAPEARLKLSINAVLACLKI
tara:strand:- start:305 stop:823 length:519 start_codon:yes stop_codon:yes gene_type:complete